MSIRLQMDVESLRREVNELKDIINKGLTDATLAQFHSIVEEQKDMKAKYHMLNARLSKYKVD